MLPIYFFDDAWHPDPAGLNWRAAGPAEVAAGSQVVDAAWVRWGCSYGTSTFKIVAWDAHAPIGQADVSKDYWALPGAARVFTVEGRRSDPGAVPFAYLLQRAK